MRDRGLAGGDVDGAQRPRHGRDRLHRRPDPQGLAGRHAALGAAGAARRTPDALGGAHDLVVRQRAGVGGEVEAVADLDALDRLDAHQRAGQPGVEPAVPVHVGAEARRQAVRRRPRRPRRGCRRRRGPGRSPPASPCWRRRRGSAPGRRRASPTSSGTGHRARRRPRRADRRRRGRRPAAPTACSRNCARDRAQRHPRRGLPGGGALQDRPGLVEVVLLHADQVGVTGPRTGQRGVAGQRLELGLVDRVGRHHLLPLGPLGVADPDRDRAAERLGRAAARR